MYYRIEESLRECERGEIFSGGPQYVCVLTPAEWTVEKESFQMGIDLDPERAEIIATKAEVNYDSLTGTFVIPDRDDLDADGVRFAFALDEKGVVFIDGTGTAASIVARISRTRRWKMPGLERFLYDFLEEIIRSDYAVLERYEEELDREEERIVAGLAQESDCVGRINTIRGQLRVLRNHYEQLMDFGQELEENENNFFRAENLRYFRLFCDRIERLYDISSGVRDYTMQLLDLYNTFLDVRQNRIMTVLTVVTAIFMPLTLIAGWYGMNFVYMPLLHKTWGYPAVIVASLTIVVAGLWYFRHKKWL